MGLKLVAPIVLTYFKILPDFNPNQYLSLFDCLGRWPVISLPKQICKFDCVTLF